MTVDPADIPTAESQPPPPPPAAPAPADVTTASSSNAQPGVDLETGKRTDDDADREKRDAAVRKLAAQYDDPEQQRRVLARIDQ